METLILYWQVSWPLPDRVPTYRYRPMSEVSCMAAITRVRHELPKNEMIGSWIPNQKECWLVIWPDDFVFSHELVIKKEMRR